MLHLTTFGGLTLRMGDAQLTGPPTQRRRLALLALLAVAGDRGMSREKLLALLWPESDEERARHGLNQILFAQRRHFEGAPLFEGKKTLRLNPTQIACDVRAFEEALARGADEEAVGLYAGPFLDGFFLSNSTEFEQWAADQRDRLATLCATAIANAGSRAANAGDWPTAVKWQRRAVELDPLDASRVIRLADSLAKNSDRTGAIRVLRNYQERVKRELGISGEPEIIRKVAVLTGEMGGES